MIIFLVNLKVHNANSRPMKQPIPLALELTFLSVMTTVVINVCSAGVPQDSAGVWQQMELKYLGPEEEDNPNATPVKVCCYFGTQGA